MDCIAERVLELAVGDAATPVHVRLERPHLHDSGSNWVCSYQIESEDFHRRRAVHGEDSMQALQLALSALALELDMLKENMGGTLLQFGEPFHSILENGRLQVVSPWSDG